MELFKMKKKITSLFLTGLVLANTSFFTVDKVHAEDNLDVHSASDYDNLFNLVYTNSDTVVEEVVDDYGNTFTEVSVEFTEPYYTNATKLSEDQATSHTKSFASFMIDLDVEDVIEEREELLSREISTYGSGSLTDGANHSYGGVKGTVNYVTTNVSNVTYYGIKNISGQFITNGSRGAKITNRKMDAGQVGKNPSGQRVNKKTYYTPTKDATTTYTQNWTSNSLVVVKGASVVGMNISATVHSGTSSANVSKSVTVINY